MYCIRRAIKRAFQILLYSVVIITDIMKAAGVQGFAGGRKV
jgi:hypothetical protein